MPDLPPTLPTELHPFAVLAGRWEDGVTEEWWVAAGDVWWGVSFGPDGWFEVMHLDRVEGQTRLVAQPKGTGPVPFSLVEQDAGSWRFTNPANDAPQQIRYQVRGRRLLGAIGNEQLQVVLRGRSRPVEVLPALLEADRAFHRDVAARGVDAWLDAFGHQWDRKAARAVTRADGMAELMDDVLAGTLDWDPVIGGVAPGGTLGFTVGTSTWTPPGQTEPGYPGSYLTVWRRQPDGAWKVLFDTGDPLGPG
jgi:Domain of unknown function (DUF6265)